jgi:hypothetical protein
MIGRQVIQKNAPALLPGRSMKPWPHGDDFENNVIIEIFCVKPKWLPAKHTKS